MNYDEINFNEQDQMSGNVFKFENVGDSVKGTYIGKKEGVQTKFGDKVIYRVMNNEGVNSIFGTAMLDDQMLSISLGQVIEIKLVGEKDTGKGNPQKLLQVYGRANLVNQEWIDQQKEASSIGTVETTTNNNTANDGEIDVDNMSMEQVWGEDDKTVDGEITTPPAPAQTAEAIKATMTVDEKKDLIKTLAVQKLGVPENEDHSAAVMTKTKVALIDDNLDEIIKILQTV